MNIYQPYDELADTADTLHLKLSDVREGMLFTVHRGLPLALFLMVWFIVQQLAMQIPMGFNYLLILLAAAGIVLLFVRPYVTELKITGGSIFMVKKTVTGTREVNIAASEIAGATLLDKKTGRGGIKFILLTKTKQHIVLLHIPRFWMDDKHNQLIKETLQQLLHV
jgi:hypothetical protein